MKLTHMLALATMAFLVACSSGEESVSPIPTAATAHLDGLDAGAGATVTDAGVDAALQHEPGYVVRTVEVTKNSTVLFHLPGFTLAQLARTTLLRRGTGRAFGDAGMVGDWSPSVDWWLHDDGIIIECYSLDNSGAECMILVPTD